MSNQSYELIAKKLGGHNGSWTVEHVKNLTECVAFYSITGAAAGDEGKGEIALKIAKMLKEHGSHVIVCGGSGGSNAGHTLIHNGHRYNTNMFPAAFMQGDITFMGSNKLFNITSFKKEVERIVTPRSDAPALTTIDHLQKILVIDRTAKMTFTPAVLQEHINEYNKSLTTGGSVGTTGQGISTTIAQFDIKCQIEVLSASNAFNNGKIDEYLDKYYITSGTNNIVEQYLNLVKSGGLKPLEVNNVTIGHESLEKTLADIKAIDANNIIWFCETFGKNFKSHNYFVEYMHEIAIEKTKSVMILEGVQANSLSPVNGPLNATTSSELNPDILMQTSFKFCDYTALAMADAQIQNVGVIKLVQSTVGHHHNPAKIRNYADLLKYEYTNENDADGRVAELLNKYPTIGKYAKLAVLTLDVLSKKYPNKQITPENLLINGIFDESALLSMFLGETGTTTGRVRELSYLDFVRINSCSFNQVVPVLALTRLDFYNIFKVFRICVGYKIDGKDYMHNRKPDSNNLVFSSYKDFTSEQMLRAEPIYVDFPSWDEQFNLEDVKKFDDFPKEAQVFIKYIEESFGKVISVNLSAHKTLFI